MSPVALVSVVPLSSSAESVYCPSSRLIKAANIANKAAKAKDTAKPTPSAKTISMIGLDISASLSTHSVCCSLLVLK